MEASRRRNVLVASGSSADRAIALERMLREAADRAGWGPRLEIRVGGLGTGAGRVTDAGLAALAAHGIDAHGAVSPDLERRPDLLEGCHSVVCDRGDVADVLVDWKEAGEADFVCVDELVLDAPAEAGGAGSDDDPGDVDDEADDRPIGDDLREYAEWIDEVLRRVVAGSTDRG